MSTARARRPPAAALFYALFCLPAAAEFLGDDELAKAFSGITLDGVYDQGIFFTETYASDGTIRYVDRNGPNSGTWSVKDGMFCTFYDNQHGACFFVAREGANCFAFYEPKAGPGGARQAREQWTSRGWNRARPSTCTDTPKGSI